MNDLSSYYPAIPTSLISNPLDARKEDFVKARRIISLIAVRNRENHGLKERNMAVIPKGVRYHGVNIGKCDEGYEIGSLQITETMEDVYSVLGYSDKTGMSIPSVMMMGVLPYRINDVLEEMFETLSAGALIDVALAE